MAVDRESEKNLRENLGSAIDDMKAEPDDLIARETEKSIRPETLMSILGQILKKPVLEAPAFSIDALGGGIGLGTQVFRVHGSDAALGSWSVVLKLFRRMASEDDPGHAFYWKREPEFLVSALARSIRQGIRPPRCYLVEQLSEDKTRVWIEDIPNDGRTGPTGEWRRRCVA